VRLTSYKLGDVCHCTAAVAKFGVTLARTVGLTREQAEEEATHWDRLCHPAVYERIRRWLQKPG